MTDEHVRRLLVTAVENAFRLGRDHAKAKARGAPEHVQLALATRYAETLVMPQVELAQQEAMEQGAIAARQAVGTAVS